MAQHQWDEVREQIRDLALGLPEAWEDFPWGESAFKVRKKVFVFMGHPDEAAFGMAVKLPESGAGLLSEPYAHPTGYGLGRSGWVSVGFAADDEAPLEEIREWILESYCAVAPKTLAKQVELPPE